MGKKDEMEIVETTSTGVGWCYHIAHDRREILYGTLFCRRGRASRRSATPWPLRKRTRGEIWVVRLQFQSDGSHRSGLMHRRRHRMSTRLLQRQADATSTRSPIDDEMEIGMFALYRRSCKLYGYCTVRRRGRAGVLFSMHGRMQEGIERWRGLADFPLRRLRERCPPTISSLTDIFLPQRIQEVGFFVLPWII